MSYAYFLIFRQDGQACAARLLITDGKEWPAAFRYEGRTYSQSPIELCDGGHLVTANHELAGFSFLLGGTTEVGKGRLINECSNAENESGFCLNFKLVNDCSYTDDGCHLLFPFVYADGNSDHMILVQECTRCWKSLGFRLATHPLPEAVYED